MLGLNILPVLRALLEERNPLDPTIIGARVRDVSFRVMEDADIPICLSLYRANEAHHFPPGRSAHYETELRSRQWLNLIALRDGEPVGCGGVSSYSPDRVGFCFGMVAPERQRQGVGTALFLARLGLLRSSGGVTTVTITVVPGSLQFYRRFGFLFFGNVGWADGSFYRLGTLHIRAEEIDACRRLLAERNITCPDPANELPQRGRPGAAVGGG
jgi:predicted N-acetyltransferase YhbS